MNWAGCSGRKEPAWWEMQHGLSLTGKMQGKDLDCAVSRGGVMSSAGLRVSEDEPWTVTGRVHPISWISICPKELSTGLSTQYEFLCVGLSLHMNHSTSLYYFLAPISLVSTLQLMESFNIVICKSPPSLHALAGLVLPISACFPCSSSPKALLDLCLPIYSSLIWSPSLHTLGSLNTPSSCPPWGLPFYRWEYWGLK